MEPTTLGECDKQIDEYRKMLTQVSQRGRVSVWEQIDKLLDIRASFEPADDAGAAA